ncbi:hypothetical protein NJC40_03525 [Pseudomonas sp. 21LCFQ02]|uniref:hypothetical protein n=1 Tax=Pseudomonas sp. 21LCFQ02 TaxID=2957505 RepID=UPI00209A7168|nr:hypothetical protein [Pseudomonas sp. 21LCFQ02]MCO8166848.1 hypothetical protein [Pseudomonas sp. 21LCFQ02]
MINFQWVDKMLATYVAASFVMANPDKATPEELALAGENLEMAKRVSETGYRIENGSIGNDNEHGKFQLASLGRSFQAPDDFSSHGRSCGPNQYFPMILADYPVWAEAHSQNQHLRHFIEQQR